MVEIAVIADDLTGAADTGIQFRPVYADTLLMAAAALAADGAAPTADVLSIHTASRALVADDARDRVAETARRLINLSPHRVYKKVDSCLRGNAGAEIEALVETIGLEMSFVAPAFPQMGRTTEDDIHRVHGVPVAESEMGRDPATPVLDNRLTAIIAGQARLSVGHVGLQAIAAGVDATAAEVKRLKESGIRHICFDATEQAHLETVAALTLEAFPKTLLVGSAGLGLALRSVLDLPPAPEDDVRAGLPDGHHLLAFGTASPRARAQIAAMRAAYPMALREIAAADLLAGGGPIAERLLDDLTGLSLDGDLVLCITPPDGPPDAMVAARLADAFGKLIAALVLRTRPASTFLSGGDTAISVLQRLGAKGLKLAREISPTLACGRVVGGVADGFIFGTKPGAMGNDDAMTEWRRFWEE